MIEDNIHISTRAIINGNCKVGRNCLIGSYTVLKHSTKICQDSIIGAGAVVTKDITESGVYVDSPTNRIK